MKRNITLADKNWFATGGSANYFCEPTTAHEFQDAINFAQKNNLELFILGQGANILVSDEGFDGVVIRPALQNITTESLRDNSVLVTAGAGVTIHDLIVFCFDNNILGLEEFSGIPGTVGGSVYINLHYFSFLLGNFLVSAQVLHKTTGTLLTVDNAWFNFGYDTSTLHNNEYYLVTATFKLTRATDLEIAYARGRHTEIIRHRTSRYPTRNTCGSFFRNFHPEEVTLESNGKKMIYVAYYLDKIGAKGTLNVGNAVVSYQHANMIVHNGTATSKDIIQLARAMQEKVYDAFGVMPQPECQLIGFKEYPLHK
ncbi:MAG TPA: UDP-N-acetylmuramate dehydrogenase [Candidatus Babeliales bacterium]|nr:UDP-N-acetylmuramate dehydrogenase [Candidatus Babeliales bacterium]